MKVKPLTTIIERPVPARSRLSEWCRSLLFSSRPRWAMMPAHVATPFVDALLFTVSLFDELQIRYVAHYGTLLGAVRLGGVAPWDEDADLYILDGDLESLKRRLDPALETHGFESRARVKGDALYVRRRPWLAGQGHIGISAPPLPEEPPRQFWLGRLHGEQHIRYAAPFYSGHSRALRFLNRCLKGSMGRTEAPRS
jgi:hypothetical protein